MVVVWRNTSASAGASSFWYYRSLQFGHANLPMICGWVALSGYGPGVFY